MQSRLKEILEERGVKQKWLQERVGMSQSAINRIINGKSVPILKDAIRIARVLQLHVEDIWILEE
ncbi:helix-turn-helix transcriptional regulator [Brevibacillus laterosporus]|uniref:helix-turn-helix transcriptional regulator n=1 Tax=Brevibacillus laterosporus TaxID=1465 RepID=UPI002E1D7136|nr:helix-turn-helix transcriptional regulator [Brevibacillus laterosporus]